MKDNSVVNDLNHHLPAIEQAARLLHGSRSVLFITGAGISADSGLPTYRGVGGLYNVNNTKDGTSIEDALSVDTMQRDPAITWKYLSQIEKACRGAKFNRAHEVIAEMENQLERVWTLTQNVDGFHHAAGSKNVIDIHGDIHTLRCDTCKFRNSVEDFSRLTIPPYCPDCGSVIRPDVVFFGEILPQAKLDRLYHELNKGFDYVFTVGTTSLFSYISYPVELAKQQGHPVVEINPGETAVSHLVNIKLRLRASDGLNLLWTYYQDRQLI